MHGKQSGFLIGFWLISVYIVFVLVFAVVLYFINFLWRIPMTMDVLKTYGVYAVVGIIVGYFLISRPFASLIEKTIIAFGKQSGKFHRGLLSEKAVRHTLERLPNSYVVFQGIQFRSEITGKKYDADFVVVGPTGVFTVDAKSHVGLIEYDGKQLTRDKHPFVEKDVLGQSKSEALAIHNIIKKRTGLEIFVNRALAFSSRWAKMHFGFKPVDGVYVVGLPFLDKLLTDQPTKFDDAFITHLENALLLEIEK